MSRTRAVTIALSCVLTATLAAAPQPARDLIVPVAGNADGAFGSKWRTDLHVTNVGLTAVPVAATFYGSFPVWHMSRVLQPNESIRFREIGWAGQVGVGVARVTSTTPGARLVAFARIYNVGDGVGAFSQIVEAIPGTALSVDSTVGLTDDPGARVNVGIASPGVPTDILLDLLDSSGAQIASRTVSIRDDRDLLQINDIFAFFGTVPVAGSIRVRSDRPVAAYASILRDGSGNADFLPAVALSNALEDIVAPACLDPAPLQLTPVRAPGYLVGLRAGVADPRAVMDALKARYEIEWALFLEPIWGFTADLTPGVVAALRCEAAVETVSENSYAFIGGR